jgi:hypothetical protein
LSTAVFQTYDDNKNAKINTANQNAVNAAQAANDQQLANQGTDLNKLRDSAEEAGFNPLTVLRATGGQGFNNSVNFVAPRLSSPTFWSTLSGNFQSNLQNSANLENTYANTAYTKRLTANVGKNNSKYDPLNKTIPFFITVKGEGGLKDTKIINPELIEASLREVQGSLTWLAAQYAAQHNVPLSHAREIVENLMANHEAFNGIDQPSPITQSNLQPSNASDYQPGVLSLDWFKNAIDGAGSGFRSHPSLPNNTARQ